VLIDELGVTVTAQQHAEAVEPGDDALELDAIDEKNREWHLLLTDVIEKGVLKAGGAFGGHFVVLSA
jgi:hypothetical protein